MAVKTSTTIQSRGGTERLESRPGTPSKTSTFTAEGVAEPVELSRQLNAQQGQVQEVLRALRTFPLVPGVLVRDVAFTSGAAQTIAHRLGRPFVGFVLLNHRTAFGGAYRTDLSPVSRHANEIQLTPSATMTADVWVY